MGAVIKRGDLKFDRIAKDVKRAHSNSLHLGQEVLSLLRLDSSTCGHRMWAFLGAFRLSTVHE